MSYSILKLKIVAFVLTFATISLLTHSAFAESSTQNNSVSAIKAIEKPQSANYNKNQERESIFPEGSLPLAISHFTWGADVGASIDVGGDDMSTFDIDVYLGYKNSFIRTLAVGAGVHRAFDNGHTFIPLYLMFRSSFRSKPSLLFFDFKGGYSFNTLGGENSQGGIYISAGLGINLAMSKKFNSHIVLSYGYFGMEAINTTAINFDGNHTNYAQIKFGVNF